MMGSNSKKAFSILTKGCQRQTRAASTAKGSKEPTKKPPNATPPPKKAESEPKESQLTFLSTQTDTLDEQTWEFVVLLDGISLSNSTAIETRSTTPELESGHLSVLSHGKRRKVSIDSATADTAKDTPNEVAITQKQICSQQQQQFLKKTKQRKNKSAPQMLCPHCDQGSFLEFCFKEDACGCICHNICCCKPCQKIRETREQNTCFQDEKIPTAGSSSVVVSSACYRPPTPFKYPNPFCKLAEKNPALAPKLNNLGSSSAGGNNSSTCSFHSFESTHTAQSALEKPQRMRTTLQAS
ncbi:hypothetical protein H4219_000373 [Mycoemilia scoparia]|uniref:Uncharacterized protein n=1 Tax=Mycoemilia scoparia TaxID=417184 RepID=A0A9W8A7D6_9FUNG|nr:hypothetical protein H4219_000373 [Mycoemilia scoparia]